MRKGTPNVPLSVVKEMVRSGKVKTTFTATQGALELGFPAPVLPLMCKVVLLLDQSHFYKSMTAYHDETIWHDVYRTSFDERHIYLKLIVKDDVLIVSFKEL
ncbi:MULTISPECIES: type II toxin-antitoxin system MqsR family toxin [Atlantibacter]|uniref:type II toxin-antitoxin system MqsR family toxin n=1 Tax=Atlantibacter TaxID=1903434 RepID=UPI000EE7C623|nr:MULTISPECIES: type II toxin-antitoxin system MqsR family toxin [Atlantibacter]HAI51174.1 toxin-antitoxin system, toxin component [Enterobacteriaceae bacterium]